ncbi:hypothetical protein N7478_001384 [Penicillium angulare]|uniref:uncharacterized protein n=1 Tax=Penicillium angulare TaxID=116970 RepID=UPI00253FAF6F|nr:uncharacterized protein N7478_001384 [Penicillium angulare]KAJ5292133.1 hypothetical protein N7478_001384 [Penicillium angulare]
MIHADGITIRQPQGEDFILATGEAYNVRQFVEIAFKTVGIRIHWSGKDLTEYFRTLENENLLGSPHRAKKILGWERTYSFENLVEEMVQSDIKAVKQGKLFANTNLDWLVGENDNVSDSSEGSPGRI